MAKKTAAPTITKSPLSVTVAPGHKVVLKAAASGKPTPTVGWEVSTNGGTTFTPVSGATARRYSFTAAPGDNADRYEAVFTNSVGTATTAAATLTVTVPTTTPTVTTSPSSVTVASGDTATFTATATGSPTPTVQWQFSTDGGATFAAVGGATATTYAFTTTTG